MSDYETIEYDVSGDGVLVITLSRPDRLNAFTPMMCEELVASFGRASSSDDVGAVIVTGAGRAFCAGMDLSSEGNVFGLDEGVTPSLDELTKRFDEPDMLNGVRDTGGRVALAIRACHKPVVAAINGSAVGIGATMTLAMDVRMAVHGARIGFVFGRIGITPEACSTWYLPRLVGLQTAFEWVYSAELIDAAEAQAAGLVRSLHAPDLLMRDARALALRFIQGKSRVATAVARELLLRNCAEPTPWQTHLTESLAVHHLSKGDGKEGVAAFLEKRAPNFTSTLSEGLPPGFPWEKR